MIPDSLIARAVKHFTDVVAPSGRSRGGMLHMTGWAHRPDLVKFRGLLAADAALRWPDLFQFDRKNGTITVQGLVNAYVRSGNRNSLLREFNPGSAGTVVAGIGVGVNNTVVTVNTRFLNGATAGLNGAVTGQTVSIKAISPAATIVTDGSSVVQIVTGGATWTEADFFNSIAFVWNKIGLTLAVPASNASEVDGNLVDVIGGGGSAPYNKSFGLDFSNAAPFSQTGQIAVTGSAA